MTQIGIDYTNGSGDAPCQIPSAARNNPATAAMTIRRREDDSSHFKVIYQENAFDDLRIGFCCQLEYLNWSHNDGPFIS
jgi:hypothetical protein